jgi:hypothetical protein
MSEEKEPIEKKIDESWKEQVDKDKEKVEENTAEQKDLPVDFGLFISSLSMQALVMLGEIPNPVTKEKAQDLFQAKYIIDTLDMLRQKTKGNLTKEEEEGLEEIIYHLRVKYVSLKQ